jgi:hypothetical protein
MISYLIKSNVAGTMTVQYDTINGCFFLRMDQPMMYFSVAKLLQIKNVILDVIRELRECRLDWKTFKCSSKKKMLLKMSYASPYVLDCLVKPSGMYEHSTYYIRMKPEEANAFVRDIKDILVRIRLKTKIIQRRKK